MKIKGKKGTFRFGCVNLWNGVPHSVEVVGPCDNAKRKRPVGGHHELSRVFTIDRLLPAPGVTRADVESSVTTPLSMAVKIRRGANKP